MTTSSLPFHPVAALGEIESARIEADLENKRAEAREFIKSRPKACKNAADSVVKLRRRRPDPNAGVWW